MFNISNFCHVASNNRNEQKAGIFIYKTNDDLATVTTSGYFNKKIIDINIHDIIIHEQINPLDKTDVTRNILCVIERTLENVATKVIHTQWEIDTDATIEEIQQNIEDILQDLENKADKTSDFQTPITESNKGATMKEIEEVQATSIVFKGYVSTTEPDSATYALVQNNLWINSATMPTVFPVPQANIQVWDGVAWKPATEDYSPKIFDAWSNINENEGYYWFGAWKVFSTELSPEFFVLNQTSGQYELKNLSVGNQQISENAIDSGKISDGAITDKKLAGQPSFSGKAGSAVFVNQSANGFEFKKLSNTFVDLTSNQIINGRKKFKSDVDVIDPGHDSTVPQIQTRMRTLNFLDKNSVRLGAVRTRTTTDGKRYTELVCENDQVVGNFSLVVEPDGTKYAIVEAPAAEDSSTKVATTGWVRQNASMAPNYSAGVSVPSGQTFNVPANGFIKIGFSVGDQTLRINGQEFFRLIMQTGISFFDVMFMPVAKGDKISYGGADATFFPAK